MYTLFAIIDDLILELWKMLDDHFHRLKGSPVELVFSGEMREETLEGTPKVLGW